jgi:predicted chitinase
MDESLVNLLLALPEMMVEISNSHDALARIVADHASGIDDETRRAMHAAIAKHESGIERLEHSLAQAKARLGRK